MASPAAATDAESSRSGCPRRSSRPAIGSTAMGSIKAPPTFCRLASKALTTAPPRLAGVRARRARARRRAALALSPASRDRPPADALLQLRNHGRNRRQLVHPESDEQRRRQRLGGESPAYRGVTAVRARALHRARDQAQYRRMQRVEPVSELRMAAIHGEGVLGQIGGSGGE